METIVQYVKPYSDPPKGVRNSSRGLIIRDGKVLLSYETNTDVYMSPGGGVEAGESLEECCKRELREETGYKVEVITHFLTVNEYSFETLYVSNYFICKIIGKGEQSLTDIEIEHGIVPEWVEISKALEMLGDNLSKREDIGSLYKREYTMINKYLEIKV